jgi:predicted ATP-dependent endonuclease of OLD family
MHIKTININNFRLLKESTLQLNQDKKQVLSLLIGKNNSGKTSFIVLFDKFLRNESYKFNFNDFPISNRKEILDINSESDLSPILINMKIEIVYSKDDNLENLSDFILDLDPEENIVKLYFECTIEQSKLLSAVALIKEEHKKKFIENNLCDFLTNRYFVYKKDIELEVGNRNSLVEKSISDIRKLINYQVIHAKRNVSSSEFSGNGKTALSELTTTYFNKDNVFSQEAFASINDTILEMDETLNKEYAKHFKEYFDNVKQFVDGGTGQLNVVSNLESKQILSNYSKVIYGGTDTYLPETYNGLGHLNILFLLLQIEVKRKFFEQEKRDINLLFIEEPEAHTHPQMQYIFAKKIKDVLKLIPNIQSFITTHSSHIVSQCDFEDIRYFKIAANNIIIKDFYKELEAKYATEPEYFKFLKQYLTLYSSELFFAEKIIFIEGVSEKLLMPFFIMKYDKSRESEEGYVPLTSQNISYIEAGANARVFCHFLEFLDIKTLIITDLDGCEIRTSDKGKKYWGGCKTSDAINTTNVTIKYYLNAPDLPEIKERDNKVTELTAFNKWFDEVKENSLDSISKNIKVAYQIKEDGYHARSFEDAFLSRNLDLIYSNIDDLHGLKCKSEIVNSRTDFYELTQRILKDDGKSDFASSILYLALTKDIFWITPKYIIEGLNWISE